MGIDHPVDVAVGKQLRTLRKKLNLSQANLAEMLGISHQQIQKYELGVNRISASTLYELAQLLRVPVSYFFEEIDGVQGSAMKTLTVKRENPLTILLVEDDGTDELLMREALDLCDIDSSVFVVRDGAEAMSFLRRPERFDAKMPDIVVLDLNIPRKDGLSVLREIKGDAQLAHLPVIVLTNSIFPDDMREAYAACASGYLVKSFDVKEFNRSVSEVVRYWSRMVLPSMQGQRKTA